MLKFYLAFLLSIPVNIFPVLAQSDNSIKTYRNPVIPGDYPDPTIIRVGENYYAAGTSGNNAPNYPLYESKDLINWTRIGAVFNEVPEWTSGDFWAPEMFYNNGTYFVYYTAKRKSDNVSCIGVATTNDVHQGFKDLGIIIEWGNEAIDAFVFKDSDGKLYIIWKAYGLNRDRPVEILASELSPDGLKLVGEHFSLTRPDKGWIGHGDEGPCLVKHGAYYYLFYSIGGCCDNRCDYRVMVARSKSLKGDWEQYKNGPILQGGEQWRCSGHGTLVESADKRFFYMYHAYNEEDFEYVGRQGMLDEVLWDEKTGWPFFKYGNTPSSQAEVPFKNTVQKRETVFHDDFSSQGNLKYWLWDIKNFRPDVLVGNNQLVMTNINSTISFFGLGPKTGNFTFETCVVNKGQNIKGLCIYGNRTNFLGFGTTDLKVSLFQNNRGIKSIISEYDLPQAENVYLRVTSTNGRLFRFFWSVNQKEWIPCKGKDDDVYIKGTFLPGMRPGLMVERGDENVGVFSFVNVAYSF
jgi:xylan 1,4-beta-xylosidase